VHEIAACAVDVRGRVVLAYGDVDTPVFLRSAAKPFIAAAIVASGAAQRFEFTEAELAVVAASHAGEAFHVAAVSAILEKIGLDASALQCGVAPAFAAGEAPSSLRHGCSGKHAGILAMCVHLGFGVEDYLEPQHPAEQQILEFCARIVDEDPTEFPLGIDGCGIPVFATTLRRAALGFARLATLEGVAGPDAAALGIVRDAMAAAPAYVGGTARFDTALIGSTGGRVVGKAGAEGVHGDALLRERLGFVLKVIDGSSRGVPPATIALLGELGALEAHERDDLRSFAEPEVRNVAGRLVGGITTHVPDTMWRARTS
jgi:L-asparaginase II